MPGARVREIRHVARILHLCFTKKIVNLDTPFAVMQFLSHLVGKGIIKKLVKKKPRQG